MNTYILANSEVDPHLSYHFGDIPVSCLPLATRRVINHQLDVLHTADMSTNVSVVLNSVSKADVLEDLVGDFAEILWVDPGLDYLRTVREVVLANENRDEEFLVIDGGCLPNSIPGIGCYAALARSHLHWAQPIFHYKDIDPMYFSGLMRLRKTETLTNAFSESTLERAIRRLKINGEIEFVEVNGDYCISTSMGYFRARKEYTSERVFNHIKVVDNVLEKSSVNKEKIAAEIYWYEHLPDNLRQYVPNYYGRTSSGGYRLEYIAALPLNELFVFGEASIDTWRLIFQIIKRYFSHAATCEIDVTGPLGTDLQSLLITKTEDRIKELGHLNFFSLDHEYSINGNSVGNLREVVNECFRAAKNLPTQAGFFHGDLCLSNMIFEPVTQSIKIFDPRGQGTTGNNSVVGDPLYDLLKLAHSVLGMYDFIIAGSYVLEGSNFDFELTFDEPVGLLDLQNLFLASNFIENIPTKSLLPVLPLLFISMLPLHSDCERRQQALLANALRIYQLVN